MSLIGLAPSTEGRIGVIAVLGLIAVVSWRRTSVPASELRIRLPRCVLGLVCFGVGISMFFAGSLGLAPWDVLHEGIARRTGIDVGLVINLVGLALLPLWIPLKQRIGLGTVCNAVIIGVTVDLALPILGHPHQLWTRIGLTLVGVVVVAIGSGWYIGSDLGAGPRDGLMLGLAQRGLSVRTARTLVEAATLCGGWALGGTPGVGTVIFLVGIGPLVHITLPRLSLTPLNSRDRLPASR